MKVIIKTIADTSDSFFVTGTVDDNPVQFYAATLTEKELLMHFKAQYQMKQKAIENRKNIGDALTTLLNKEYYID